MGNCVTDPKVQRHHHANHNQNRKPRSMAASTASMTPPKTTQNPNNRQPNFVTNNAHHQQQKPLPKETINKVDNLSTEDDAIMENTSEDVNYVPPVLPEGPCNISNNVSIFK